MPFSGTRVRRTRSRWLAGVLAVALGTAALVFASPTSDAEAVGVPTSILEGGYIIGDADFFDADALSAAGIQSFLNARVASCASGYTCLKSYKADMPAKAADRYCTAVAAAKGVSAATIISRVGLACGISPKVILVMLQKEQGLVTSTAPSSSRYGAAMGFNCPDTTGCSSASLGFFTQVYGGARQLQVYTKNPGSFGYQAGRVNTIKWSPSSSCGTSKVYIQNQATANLYIYTPYRPNVAALAAGSGTGDACSSYGNRNFYNYYVTWFGGQAASSGTAAPAALVAVPPCQSPPAADVAAATGSAIVDVSVANARKAPTGACTAGAVKLAKGAAIAVTGKYGAWTRGTLPGGATVWVVTTSTNLAQTAAAGSANACAVPAAASVTPASGTVKVTLTDLNARRAPAISCETGKALVHAGQEFARTATYGVWWRITVAGASYWAHSDYLTVVSDAPAPAGGPAATACVVPKSGVTAATGTYVVRSGTATARTAPAAVCATGAKSVAGATPITRTGVYGAFTRVSIGGKSMWIATAQLKAAPRMTVKSAVHLRAKPTTASASLTVLPTGKKVAVLGTSGTWKKVLVGGRIGWVKATFLR